MDDSLGLLATIIGIAPSLAMSVAIEAADIVFMLLGLLVVVLGLASAIFRTAWRNPRAQWA
jgi:cation transport ATPase